jgi:hypothetical protein
MRASSGHAVCRFLTDLRFVGLYSHSAAGAEVHLRVRSLMPPASGDAMATQLVAHGRLARKEVVHHPLQSRTISWSGTD